MKNEELVKDYTADIEMMTHDDYLQRKYYDKSPECKKNTLNNLTLHRDYLQKYKKDFIAYFRKDYIYQCKKEINPFAFSISCATVGIVTTIGYLLLHQLLHHDIYLHGGYNPQVLAIYAGFIILPTIYERVILPIYKSHKRYNAYLNNISTKLEIIKNYQRENAIKETKKEDKSLNGVDSFIKLIISYKNELESLKEEDQQRIKIELVKLSKDYMEYIVTSSKNKGIILETNEEMVKFNKRLNEIELEINELKKITNEQEINESALEEAFGVDITKLDTSVVELNSNITGPELKRTLK